MADTTNIVRFKGDLEAFAQKLKIDIGTAMKSISRAVAERTRELTPVSSGRARDNWNMSIGAPSAEYDAHADWKKGDAHAPKPLPDLPIDGTQPVFITNNTPYILMLENGSSDQAPSGMAQLAVTAIEERARVVAKESF